MPRSRRRLRLALFAVTAIALGATAAPPASAGVPAGARLPAGHGERLVALQREIATLYQQTESATARYDTATGAITAQEAQIVALARRIVAAQAQVDALNAQLGQVAQAQYTGQAFADSPSMELFLSQDPGAYLAQIPLTRQASASAATVLQELQQAQATLTADGDAATAEWEELSRSQAAAAGAVAEIKAELVTAQGLLASLSAGELSTLQQLQAQSAFAAQMAWRGTLGSSTLSRQAHGAARAAIAYAVAQIGKPYLWGATGPRSFDCSGLTMRSWQAAGVSVPRTSQEQWAQLRHVPVSALQPGDLVVYFRDASHVALYVGDGAIIEAPHPGGVVELAAAGSMPILGVVRPS
ncbi:C40 family peptidase [Streptacidiphilus rugosus]|uniref:C40 family peptidase n=1 Tax=Streptacidiphilus rugosus TaxID=405783 RepID=UPI00055C0283|nr:NlpC/P60 family protein [Streptacidiphilus rugosus]